MIQTLSSVVLLVGVVMVHLPPALGVNMTVYAVAVGQGDGNIIQCPNGKDILIVDMGATVPRYTADHASSVLKDKFNAASAGKNIHIVVTHSHIDHYNYLPKVLDADLLKNVKQIILGDTFEHYGTTFQTWVTENIPNTYTVNGEKKCFGNSACKLTPVSGTGHYHDDHGSASDPWQFCGTSSGVTVTVLGANIGTTANSRSIVLRIVYKKWSLFMAGDFEMVEPQEELIEQYPNGELKSTYYKVAHHGAWTSKKPNLPALLAEIQPVKVYMSQGLPNMSKFHHPSCDTINNLIAVGSISDINKNLNAPFVCWMHNSSSVDVRAGFGKAIYETCRSFDGEQVCEDIVIQTNGASDYMQYVKIPEMFWLDERKLQQPEFVSWRRELEDGPIETD